MIYYTNANKMLSVKKYAYLISLLCLFLPYSAILMAEYFQAPNAFAFFTLSILFILLPILDFMIGIDQSNPNEAVNEPLLNKQLYYRCIPILFLPGYLLLITWGGYIYSNNNFNFFGELGWIMSIGAIGGIAAINVAHELIHKDTKFERAVGGILLSFVCHGVFKIIHVRVHHVHVSTSNDISSARYNQIFYHYLLLALKHHTIKAFKLEAAKMRAQGKSVITPSNELLQWTACSLFILFTFTMLWGIEGAAFFLGQSFVAIVLSEVVNYLEHYGLQRRKLHNGHYERITEEHSWNSNYLLTNIFLFQLQRHSDHHANAKRYYQSLRNHDNAPQLPVGYATMILLALVPPLWRKVMNPRVQAYYGEKKLPLDNQQQLSVDNA